MLAILTTHPIQYQVPLWQALARDGRVPFEVWYMTSHATQKSLDPEFGKSFAWDMNMLEGYPHRFLEVAEGARPGSFFGCRLTEKLRDRIRSAGVRAVWIQGWQVLGYWQAVWEAKAAGAEVWLRGESNDLAPIAWWKAPIKRLLLGQLFKRVDRFLYIGSANRRLYEKFGVPRERLYSAPYAVDNERFSSQAAAFRDSKFEIRDSWGIPRDAYCILFCGKFIPKKRPFDLIEATRLLITDNSITPTDAGAVRWQADNPARRAHLLFVGSGELGEEMRRACNVVFDAELDHRSQNTGHLSAKTDSRHPASDEKPPASFAGFLNQTEISKAYVAADVLVLASDYGETWGLVLNEANASGLGAIMSDHCGCAEDLHQPPDNNVFRFGDVRDLAAGLKQRSQRTPGRSLGSLIKRYDLSETVLTVSQVWEQLS